jgi:hypothetical protein
MMVSRVFLIASSFFGVFNQASITNLTADRNCQDKTYRVLRVSYEPKL